MRLRGDRGQATLELALCLPIAVALLGAAMETGLLALDHIRLWHAAREAVRVATVTPDEAEVRAAASDSGIAPVTVQVSPAGPLRVAGEPVSVTVTHRRKATVPLIGTFFDGPLKAAATMRIESP